MMMLVIVLVKIVNYGSIRNRETQARSSIEKTGKKRSGRVIRRDDQK